VAKGYCWGKNLHDLLVPVCKDYCHSRDQNFQCTELAQLGAMKGRSTQCSAKYKCTALCTWGLKMPEMFLKPWPSGIGPFAEHRLRLLKQAMGPGSGQFNRAHRQSPESIEVQHTQYIHSHRWGGRSSAIAWKCVYYLCFFTLLLCSGPWASSFE